MPITHHPPDDTVLRYANGTLPEAPAIVIATHLSFCPACRHRMESYEMLGGSMLDDVTPARLSADALSATLARLDVAATISGVTGPGPGPGSGPRSGPGSAPGRGIAAGTGTVAVPGSVTDSGTDTGIGPAPRRATGAAAPLETAGPNGIGNPGVKQASASRQRPDLPSGMEWPQPLRHYDIPGWRFVLPGVKWTALSLPGPEAGQLLVVRGVPGAKLPSHGHDGTEYTCVLTGSFSDSSGVYTAGDLIEATEDHDHQPIVGSDAECVCVIAIDGHLRLHGLARLLQPFLGL